MPQFEAQVILELGGEAKSLKLQQVVERYDTLSTLINNSGSTSSPQNDIPLMTGRPFLEKFIKKHSLEEKFGLTEEVTAPSILSISGLLQFLKIYNPPTPTFDQRKKNLVNSLRNSIKIEPYKYGRLSTPAYSVLVRDKDPFFASDLANKLVNDFFAWQAMRREEKYQKEIEFLNISVKNLQQEVRIAKSKLDEFFMKNSKKIS